jgi:hypothetical protein
MFIKSRPRNFKRFRRFEMIAGWATAVGHKAGYV